MELRKVDGIAVLAVVMVAAVVIGEVSVYCIDTNSYDSDVTFESTSLSYSVYSNGSDGYEVVAFNGTSRVTDLRLLIDEDFDDNLNSAREVCTVLGFDQGSLYDQLRKQLSMRGFDDVSEISSDDVGDFVSSTKANPVGLGLFVAGYSLPSSIYTGNPTDPLFEWIQNGGRLYWAASNIGQFYSDSDGVHEVTGYQELFFGTSDCICTTGDYAVDVVDNGFREALCLQNNRMEHALKASVGAPMGYVCDGYASVVIVPRGSGSVCVFSGDLPIRLTEDMAQIVSSGVDCGTVIAGTCSGTVKGTVNGSLDVSADSAYVYIGGVNTVYGRYCHA